MLRIFLPLWIIVITLIVATLTIDIYNPIIEFQKNVASQYLKRLYGGTFYLINKELATRPETEWDKYINEISEEFGYTLRLDTEEALSADIGELPPLNTDSPTLIISDAEEETDYLSIKVGTQNRILTMHLEQTEEEDSLRSAQGTLYLVNQELKQHPHEKWTEVIESLKPRFGFDIAMKPFSELQFDPEIGSDLRANKLAWVKVDDDTEYFYYYYAELDQVLQAGPLQFPKQVAMLAVIFSIIAVIIGIGVLLGLWPVWRDLSRIDKAATAFGRGELEQRVSVPRISGLRRLGCSFNDMAGSIEKLITSHRDLTNAVSHDLRTPLAKLKFAVEMLEDEIDTEERQRYQRTIKNSVGSLEHLINQLLIHSRFMRTPNQAKFTQENLFELLTAEVELCDDMTDNISVRLEADDSVKNQPVSIDRNAMIRAVNNLLSNAARYAEKEILVTINIIKKHVYIRVHDDGPGIPEADRESIFNPFTQLDNAARDSDARHGLGLAIVHQIAQWHKGEVSVGESSLGGAEFVIRCPL